MEDFTQLTQKYRAKRAHKKRDFTEANENFIDIGDMLAKIALRQPADRRTMPLDEFDDEYEPETQGESPEDVLARR